MAIIDPQDHMALPAYWQYLAREFWDGRSRAAYCDVCNAEIPRGDGYLIGSSLNCESCCLRGLQGVSEDARKNRSYDEDYFGSGMLQKARKFRYAHPDLTRGFSWRSDGSERGRVKVHCGKCGEFLFSLEARRRGSCAGCRSVETPRRVGETPTGPGWSEDLDRFRDRFSDRFSEMPDD